MLFIEPFRTILINNAGVLALVGEKGVFVHMAEQKHTPPDVIITDVSASQGQTLTRNSGLWTGRMQVTARALNARSARDIGDAVLAALDPETIEFTTVNNVQIQHCRHQNDVSYLDATTNIYTRVTDFSVGGRKV